jgi:nucleoside 2-deoxyribosyltransferase
MRIYYAAPLHEEEDQKRNAAFVEKLRDWGHKVFCPQENGIWEQMVEEQIAKGKSKEDAIAIVRHMLYVENKTAIEECQAIVAYFGNRPPSEGGLWEMGFAAGLGKPVFLYNPHDWRFNLMPEFGSHSYISWDQLGEQLSNTERQLTKDLKGTFR